LLTGKASPNDSKTVIIVVIIIGEAELALHGDRIIAQMKPGRPIQNRWEIIC
jgi:hypothetical protein